MVAAKTGRINGAGAKEPFDRWFRYAAGFSSETLDLCFQHVNARAPDGPIADGFAGVATVGTRAAREERDFVGIETHPLIAHIGDLKLNSPADPERLVELGERIAAEASPMSIEDEAELVRRSFAPEVLAELVGLRERIKASRGPWRSYLELALLAGLREHASVKVGWPYQLPGKPRKPRSTRVTGRFLERLERMKKDLETMPDGIDSTIVCADSREADSWAEVRRRECTAAISSPPYLNNFDYADATRLELYFSKRASSWAEMCKTVRSGMVVASTQQALKGPADAALAELEACAALHPQVAAIVERLGERRRDNSRTKRYDFVVPLYFAGLRKVFRNLKASLPGGAPVVMIVGDSAPYEVYIDTPGLLSVLAKDLGFEHLATETIRVRGARWSTNGSRHQIPLSEKLIVWGAPG